MSLTGVQKVEWWDPQQSGPPLTMFVQLFSQWGELPDGHSQNVLGDRECVNSVLCVVKTIAQESKTIRRTFLAWMLIHFAGHGIT